MTSDSNDFLRLFSDTAPALRLKLRDGDEESKLIRVRHKLGAPASRSGVKYLSSFDAVPTLLPFREFYASHDGLELCACFDAITGNERPLLAFQPAATIEGFTRRYKPGGDRAWIMDFNSSKSLYRSVAPWIAFAEIGGGPACLTIFSGGDNAGRIFYAASEPGFNILKSIAANFPALLGRVAKDPAAFLRLVRATVAMRGDDGHNYGYRPVEYVPQDDQL